MNRCLDTIRAIAVAVILSATVSPALYSQNYASTPIEISTEKVRVDGKVCYSHIVQERQTLFSISKAYGVSIEDRRNEELL